MESLLHSIQWERKTKKIKTLVRMLKNNIDVQSNVADVIGQYLEFESVVMDTIYQHHVLDDYQLMFFSSACIDSFNGKLHVANAILSEKNSQILKNNSLYLCATCLTIIIAYVSKEYKKVIHLTRTILLDMMVYPQYNYEQIQKMNNLFSKKIYAETLMYYFFALQATDTELPPFSLCIAPFTIFKSLLSSQSSIIASKKRHNVAILPKLIEYFIFSLKQYIYLRIIFRPTENEAKNLIMVTVYSIFESVIGPNGMIIGSTLNNAPYNANNNTISDNLASNLTVSNSLNQIIVAVILGLGEEIVPLFFNTIKSIYNGRYLNQNIPTITTPDIINMQRAVSIMVKKSASRDPNSGVSIVHEDALNSVTIERKSLPNNTLRKASQRSDNRHSSVLAEENRISRNNPMFQSAPKNTNTTTTSNTVSNATATSPNVFPPPNQNQNQNQNQNRSSQVSDKSKQGKRLGHARKSSAVVQETSSKKQRTHKKELSETNININIKVNGVNTEETVLIVQPCFTIKDTMVSSLRHIIDTICKMSSENQKMSSNYIPHISYYLSLLIIEMSCGHVKVVPSNNQNMSNFIVKCARFINESSFISYLISLALIQNSSLNLAVTNLVNIVANFDTYNNVSLLHLISIQLNINKDYNVGRKLALLLIQNTTKEQQNFKFTNNEDYGHYMLANEALILCNLYEYFKLTENCNVVDEQLLLKAVRVSKQCLELDPNNTRIRFLLAYSYVLLNKLDEARGVLTENNYNLLLCNLNDYRPIYLLCLIESSAKNYKDAYRLCKLALMYFDNFHFNFLMLHLLIKIKSRERVVEFVNGYVEGKKNSTFKFKSIVSNIEDGSNFINFTHKLSNVSNSSGYGFISTDSSEMVKFLSVAVVYTASFDINLSIKFFDSLKIYLNNDYTNIDFVITDTILSKMATDKNNYCCVTDLKDFLTLYNCSSELMCLYAEVSDQEDMILEGYARRAIKLSRKSSYKPYLVLAEILSRTGRSAEAKDCYYQAIAIEKRQPLLPYASVGLEFCYSRT